MKRTRFALFLIIISHAFFACQKKEQTRQIEQQFIDEAKNYFYASICQTNEIGERTFLQSLIKTPVWEELYVKNISVGKAIVVPLRFSENVSFKSSLSAGKERKINDISRLILYKGSDGKFVAEVVKYLSDSTFIDGKVSRFSGIAIVEDWDGHFKKGYKYTNHKFSLLSKRTEQEKRDLNSLKPKLAYVQQIGTTCYWEDVIRCAVYDGYSYNCYLLYTEFMGCEDNYDGPPIGSGGAGGGDYQEMHTPHYVSVPVVQDVSNKLTNPCMDSAFKAITSDKIKNYIRNAYASQLVNQDGINVDIVQEDHLYNTRNEEIPAQSEANSSTSTWTIRLSNTYANNHSMSQEAWGMALIHEILEIIVDQNPAVLEQGLVGQEHSIIFSKLIAPTKDLLQQAFGMNESDAQKMALVGLDDLFTSSPYATNYNREVLETYQTTYQEVKAVFQQYTNGSKGKLCGR